MKKWLQWLLAIVVVVGILVVLNCIWWWRKGGTDPVPLDIPVSAEGEALARGNAAFAMDLYQKLRTREGNLFLSPYSISTALAMAWSGARADTETQMATALHLPPDRETVHPAFAELASRLQKIQERGHVKLSTANSLWPQKEYPFLEDYLSLLKEYYGVTVTPVDYVNAPGTAANLINAWVEEETQKKIQDIVDRAAFDALTRLVLVNAIYFKGNWKSQFNPSSTEESVFNLTPDETVQVPMMDQTHEFTHLELPECQVLELPYIGQDLSMLILLPWEMDGLAEVEASLSAESLAQMRSDMYERKVWVRLPRFKITSEFGLSEMLKAMGMPDAFDEARANFAGMDGKTNWLYIDDVIHKAFVEVNEEGTEAAAATVVVYKGRGGPPRMAVFHADHPFLFLIQENRTGSILFMGRVTDPTDSGE